MVSPMDKWVSEQFDNSLYEGDVKEYYDMISLPFEEEKDYNGHSYTNYFLEISDYMITRQINIICYNNRNILQSIEKLYNDIISGNLNHCRDHNGNYYYNHIFFDKISKIFLQINKYEPLFLVQHLFHIVFLNLFIHEKQITELIKENKIINEENKKLNIEKSKLTDEHKTLLDNNNKLKHSNELLVNENELRKHYNEILLDIANTNRIAIEKQNEKINKLENQLDELNKDYNNILLGTINTNRIAIEKQNQKINKLEKQLVELNKKLESQ